MIAQALADQVAALAHGLPSGLLRHLTEDLQTWRDTDRAYRRFRVSQLVPHPRFRRLIEDFVDAWDRYAPHATPESMALALAAAEAAQFRGRQEEGIAELIWTGPAVERIPLRRTDQALLEVIQAARRTLLIVSFAVYRISAICKAIEQAGGRGVKVMICVEAPHLRYEPDWKGMVHAFGHDTLRHAHVYVWPEEHRPQVPNGGLGVLHAKCAVADESLLFISSANLTEYAMNLNMELGILLRGGPLPGRVAAQFGGLIERGILRRVSR
jgi:phosphatidylserine/phosphatidylglycerophosphate/cardiolipin synthase-like enzyme